MFLLYCDHNIIMIEKKRKERIVNSNIVHYKKERTFVFLLSKNHSKLVDDSILFQLNSTSLHKNKII